MVCSCTARACRCLFSVSSVIFCRWNTRCSRKDSAVVRNYYRLVFVQVCMHGAGSWTAAVAGLQVLLVLIVDVMLGTAIQGPHSKHTQCQQQCQQQHRGHDSTAGLSMTCIFHIDVLLVAGMLRRGGGTCSGLSCFETLLLTPLLGCAYCCC